jgi:hypothetical protein
MWHGCFMLPRSLIYWSASRPYHQVDTVCVVLALPLDGVLRRKQPCELSWQCTSVPQACYLFKLLHMGIFGLCRRINLRKMDAHFKENERSFKIHETAKYERGISSVGSSLAQRLPNDSSVVYLRMTSVHCRVIRVDGMAVSVDNNHSAMSCVRHELRRHPATFVRCLRLMLTLVRE